MAKLSRGWKNTIRIIVCLKFFEENQHIYLRNHRISKLEEILDYIKGNTLWKGDYFIKVCL